MKLMNSALRMPSSALEGWLPDMDLNHDKQIQSLLCYRYTIGQTGTSKVEPSPAESRIERASQSAQEPLQRIAGTLTRWFNPIVRYIRQRYTNGMTEGFNNKIKLIQRMAYGLRNEYNRQKRILAWCGET